MEKRKGPVENMAGSIGKKVVDPGFWKGKKVLVTGHTGFKGPWLCLWLSQMGARVTGVALPPPTRPSLFEAADIKGVLERCVNLDIRDGQKLKTLLRATEPQIVFHMAAQPLVRDSYRDPTQTYAINVMGTVNLFEAVRSISSLRVVVNVTTDKCYENVEHKRGYVEQDPLGGYDPYSSSKACSEIVTAAYRRSFFNPDEYKKHGVAVATARAGNVIGAGDWARDRLVPDCIRALMKKKDIILRNPQAVRPWQHVLEPLCGYLMLAEKLFSHGPHFASAWNFGPNKQDVLTVRQITEGIIHRWGGHSKVEVSPGSHPHEAGLLMLDIGKARREIGYRPRLSVAQALDWTIDGYKRLAAKDNAREVLLQQLNCYQNSL